MWLSCIKAFLGKEIFPLTPPPHPEKKNLKFVFSLQLSITINIFDQQHSALLSGVRKHVCLLNLTCGFGSKGPLHSTFHISPQMMHSIVTFQNLAPHHPRPAPVLIGGLPLTDRDFQLNVCKLNELLVGSLGSSQTCGGKRNVGFVTCRGEFFRACSIQWCWTDRFGLLMKSSAHVNQLVLMPKYQYSCTKN